MKIETISQARALADTIRAENPVLAASIDKMIDDLNNGHRDGINITADIKFRLEKFEGDRIVETIEGTG